MKLKGQNMRKIEHLMERIVDRDIIGQRVLYREYPDSCKGEIKRIGFLTGKCMFLVRWETKEAQNDPDEDWFEASQLIFS